MLVRADLPVAIRFAGFWLEQAGRFAPVRSLFGVVSPVGGASWLGEPGQWCGLRPVRWWGGGGRLGHKNMNNTNDITLQIDKVGNSTLSEVSVHKNSCLRVLS